MYKNVTQRHPRHNVCAGVSGRCDQGRRDSKVCRCVPVSWQVVQSGRRGRFCFQFFFFFDLELRYPSIEGFNKIRIECIVANRIEFLLCYFCRK